MPDFVVIAIAAILVAVLLLVLFPSLRVRLLYRFRIYGRENVPASGGCLIVCNHVTYLDALLLRVASPRRLTFVPHNDPQTIAAALDRGEAVLMFPEGRCTRSGHLLPFGPELGQVLERVKQDVPVIPACLDGLWGSVFSHENGRVFWKCPKAFRPPVGVMFGKPSPLASTPDTLRAAIQELSADCAIRQSDFIPLVHRVFVRTSRRRTSCPT